MGDGDALLNDSRYKSVRSSSPASSGYLYLVFSKEAGESNAPLQQIKLETGVPCMYTDLKNSHETDKEISYFPTEFDVSTDECDEFDTSMKGGDTRYRDLGDKYQWSINEYDLQKNSGVYSTMKELPYSDELMAGWGDRV